MKRASPRSLIVLGRERWRRVRSLKSPDKLDLMLIYLTLLAGTDAGQSATTWSVASVHSRFGMNKERAKRLIRELEAHGLLQPVAGAKGRRQDPRYLLTLFEERDEPIFLPTALLSGLGDETPVLSRVRELNMPLALEVLIETYGGIATDASYAVDPALYRREIWGLHQREIQASAHAVWSFKPSVSRSRWEVLSEPIATDLTYAGRLRAFRELRRIGATWEETWVCGGPSDIEPEPIFPLTGELERAAHTAGAALLKAKRATLPPSRRLVPFPAHMAPPHVLSLLRVKIEPVTPVSAAALRERERIETHWQDQLDRTAHEARAGIFDRALRLRPD